VNIECQNNCNLDKISQVLNSIESILERLENQYPKNNQINWETIESASSRNKLSKSQLYRLIKTGRIPTFSSNLGGGKGKILLSRHDLDKLIVFGHCGRLTPDQKRFLKERMPDD